MPPSILPLLESQCRHLVYIYDTAQKPSVKMLKDVRIEVPKIYKLEASMHQSEDTTLMEALK